jgi:hypothetical protein
MIVKKSQTVRTSTYEDGSGIELTPRTTTNRIMVNSIVVGKATLSSSDAYIESVIGFLANDKPAGHPSTLIGSILYRSSNEYEKGLFCYNLGGLVVPEGHYLVLRKMLGSGVNITVNYEEHIE